MANDCPHCERSFPAKKALERHIQRAHPDASGPGSRTSWIVGGLALLAVAVVGIGLMSGGGDGASQFHIQESPHQGDPDAPVALVAFESPACTACRSFHLPRGEDPSVISRVKDVYVDTGKIVYVEKYARAGYPWETVGAHTQKCAYNEFGTEAFFDLTQRFYEQQPQIDSSNVLRFATTWASDNGFDPRVMEDCTREERYQDQLTQDLGDGEVAGVVGTPTFFVVSPDGQAERVPLGSFSTFATAIEEALSKVEEAPEEGSSNASNSTQAEGNGSA